MLDVLRRIVQEVSSAANSNDTLRMVVSRVQEAMNTEVCSVYLYDQDDKNYLLMATEGLNQDSVGHVSLGYSQGLVGLVGSREEPVNIDDAPTHPRYHHLPETGEEKFHSFLGVPIIHHRRLMGVLVVQQKQSRRFDEGEEAFLVTVSAQLAGVIAHAEATGNIKDASGKKISGKNDAPRKDARFIGVPGAPGVGLGTAVVLFPPADLASVPDKEIPEEKVAREIEKLEIAVNSVRRDIKNVRAKLSKELRPEELALFDVYLQMLDDNALTSEVIKQVEQGNWVQGSLRIVIQQYVGHFELMDDPYLRERATDIRDLGGRLLSHLQTSSEAEPLEFPDDTILVSQELTPAMLGEVPIEKLRGLISIQGSSNSHVAILARAMGVPTVMGLVDVPSAQFNGLSLIVDGYRGRVFSNPTDELRANYQQIFDDEQLLNRDLQGLSDKPAITKDGHRVQLFVNTGLITDAVRSLEFGAEGVGLYRTEVPFMVKERFPSESEQTEIYRQQLLTFAPNPVTMRTLDIGGDKSLPYFPIEEANPFLGWRGIRVTLDHPELFLLQIRSMLKASEGLNNLRIMLPMISSVDEVDDALHLLYRAYTEVREEGADIQMPQIGVMIEVPAAVYQIHDLASRVDFLSVGSNDLTQYLLAVDRNNPRVADLYDAFHPAVLNALQKIAIDAKVAKTTVSVCGEIAGTPAGAVLLMAMGYDLLSMNTTNLLKVKSIIRGIDKKWAEDLLTTVLKQENSKIISSTVDLALEKQGFGRIVRPERVQ